MTASRCHLAQSSTRLIFSVVLMIALCFICSCSAATFPTIDPSDNSLDPRSISQWFTHFPHSAPASTSLSATVHDVDEMQVILSQFNIDLTTIEGNTTCDQCTTLFTGLLQLLHSGDTTIDTLLYIACSFAQNTDQTTCHSTLSWLYDKIKSFDDTIHWKAFDYCSIVSQCGVNCCSSDVPEQIYTLLGPTPLSRHFVWAQMQNHSDAQVQIAMEPAFQNIISTLPAISRTYTTGGFKGFIYNAYFDNGFEYGKTYYYRVGTPSQWSKPFFLDIPTADIGTDANPLYALVYGDHDTSAKSEASWNLLSKMTSQRHTLHFVLMVGDNGYIDCAESRWADWGNRLQNVFTNNGLSLITLPGNHESLCYLNFFGYDYRYPRTAPASATQNVMYHSFDFGTLHGVMLNSEHPIIWNKASMDQDQVTWMDNDLTKARKNENIKWTIASLHRPLYSSWDRNVKIREMVEPVFLKHQVDVVFTGHVHCYERTTQIIDNQAVGECQTIDGNKEICKKGTAPIHILTGAAGNSHSIPGNPDSFEWSRHQDRTVGIGVLQVDSHLEHHWINSQTQEQDVFIIQP